MSDRVMGIEQGWGRMATPTTRHPSPGHSDLDSCRRERGPQPRILLELVRIRLPVGNVIEALAQRGTLFRHGAFIPVVPVGDALYRRRLLREDRLDPIRARRVVTLHAEDGAGHAAVEVPVDKGRYLGIVLGRRGDVRSLNPTVAPLGGVVDEDSRRTAGHRGGTRAGPEV